MANNTDSGWIERQAHLEKAYTGEDLRQNLIDCLIMLKKSHDIKVLKKKEEQDHFIIGDEEEPVTPGDPDLNSGGGESNG